MEKKDKLSDQLRKICERKTLVVGIGNTLKGDDGAGCIVCEQLKDTAPDRVIDAGTVAENYIGPIIEKQPEVLVVVDAIDFGDSAGEVRIFAPEELSSAAFSTHTLSPRLFVDVISQSFPLDVYFIGIQPKDMTLGEGLSKEVEEAAKIVAGLLKESISGQKRKQ